jgi:hypothetical protein
LSGDGVLFDPIFFRKIVVHRRDKSSGDFGRQVELFGRLHGAFQYPIATGFRSQLKSGLISAGRLPQPLQTKRGSRSDSRTLSGHRLTSSALSLVEWLHL